MWHIVSYQGKEYRAVHSKWSDLVGCVTIEVRWFVWGDNGKGCILHAVQYNAVYCKWSDLGMVV